MLRIMLCECVVIAAKGESKRAGCYGVLIRTVVYIIYFRYPPRSWPVTFRSWSHALEDSLNVVKIQAAHICHSLWEAAVLGTSKTLTYIADTDFTVNGMNQPK